MKLHLGLLLMAVVSVTSLTANAQTTAAQAAGHDMEGLASWYGGKFHGRLTANGETFDTYQMTAAHRTLPFGTIVRVTNLSNGKSVVVRINDRGPFVAERVIDLSRAAADSLEMTGAGIAPVRLEVLHLQLESDLRTIQVASFGSRANADQLVARLQSAGIGATIEPVPNAGVQRVIIQGVATAEVEDLRGRLAALGYPNVLVRRK